MRRSVSIVVGANYGDEGKGLTTDYLAAKANTPLVVRFNGGAQAGHTVVTPDGKRHVFHHFGSGTLAKAPTFLSRYFAVHPMFFQKELMALVKLKVVPEVFIDPLALVTTPYDVMVNQAIEKRRGDGRHGSCGMGFNETLQRCDHKKYVTYYGDLEDEEIFRIKLRRIRDEYVNQRCLELGLSRNEIPFVDDERVFERFIGDCKFLFSTAQMKRWDDFGWQGDIIFEGAQGLLLSQDHANFPHVTRSYTGVKNALDLMEEGEIDETPDAYYVTRTYITRHGAGPMRHELPQPPYKNAKCQTNVFNEHQGELRYGLINIEDLAAEINADCTYQMVNARLVITCADQCENVRYIDADADVLMSVEHFAKELAERVLADKVLISYGPTRKTMKEIYAGLDDKTASNKSAVDHKVQHGF